MRVFVLCILRSLVPLADLIFGHEPWLFVPDANGYLVRIEYDPMTLRVVEIINTVTQEELRSITFGEGATLITVGQPLPDDPDSMEETIGETSSTFATVQS